MINLNPNPYQVLPLHQTPIKRGKSSEVEPQTAESQQPVKRGFEDLDPMDLFERFDELVRVTQEEDLIDDFQPQVERRLDYEDSHTIKLDFEPKSSSMKKKSRFAEHSTTPLRAINLFQVQDQTKLENSPEKAKIPTICLTPEQKQKKPRPDLSRAAVKQAPQ